jgi:hypothetical protein
VADICYIYFQRIRLASERTLFALALTILNVPNRAVRGLVEDTTCTRDGGRGLDINTEQHK